VEHTADGTRGVAKVLKGTAPIEVARLKREVEILQSIQHPSIVRLLDADLDDTPPWYVTPHGQPLEEYWKKEKLTHAPVDLFDQALGLIRGLLLGLAEFHARGGVHRDIKPENVIVLADGGRERAVLIDFGLAYRPEDERLSVLDGRIAANRFAAPPAALYGTAAAPKPSWDCLGISWLWAWLLAEGPAPKYERYHWRFHRWLADPRCERVRALLAACSHESTVPEDAAEMLRRAALFGLGEMPVRAPPVPDFSAAKEAYAGASARSAVQDADLREKADVAAAILIPFYDELAASLKETAESAREAGLPLEINVESFTRMGVGARAVQILAELARDTSGLEGPLFACKAGTRPGKHFFITVYVRYVHRDDSFLPFSLHVRLRHEMALLDPRDVNYVHTKDGTPWINEGTEAVEYAHPVQVVGEWLGAEEHWRQTG
jgi:hypothetical protein